MYVDEVGNSDMGSSVEENHRYLSLTGIVMSLEDVEKTIHPALESLKKRYFGSHPDDPVIFHRKELYVQKPPFDALRDPAVRTAFDNEFLALLEAMDFTVLTVVIDKLEHTHKYQAWKMDPYHYCLRIIVERYSMWLRRRDAVGDVMAESRGGKEDMRLKKSFHRLLEEGTEYMTAEKMKEPLTSVQLKVKDKKNNIAGLQVADIVAHPAYRFTMSELRGEPMTANFGRRVAELLKRKKFDRNSSGRITGYGIKLLP